MKKRKGLFFLGMLFLASILFSCKEDSDDYPRTVNIKIKGVATSVEKDTPLSEYGKLFMNITQASSDFKKYNEEEPIALPTGSISVNKKLTDVMDQFSLEFYLVQTTENQVTNLNKKKHGDKLGDFNLSYEIISSNGEKKTGEKKLAFYANQINFYPDGTTNPDPEDSLIESYTTDCIWALADSSMSLSIKTDTEEPLPENPTYIKYDGKELDIDESSILEIPEHAQKKDGETDPDKRAKVNVKFISTPSDDFFNFGNKTSTDELQFGDVAYLAQSEYAANTDKVKDAFDNGALLMMLGGNLEDVATIFDDLSIDTSYISETELETGKGDPVFFIGQYKYSTGEETDSNTFFEVLYTKEASDIEASNKIAVNQMARQIILAYNNLDDIAEEIKNNPNNPASSIRAASGEEIKNILKNYGTADATISQRFYQKIPIKHTWNYIRNGWDGALGKYKKYGSDYELVDAHYRNLLVWFIHVYPDKEKGEKYGKHYYYIQDMPSFTYKNTYFGQVSQAVGNDTEKYRVYGGGSSPVTMAKTQEFYGREAEISFEPASSSDIYKVEWCYDDPKTQDVDLKKSSTSGWSFTATANGSIGSGGKKKASIEASASYNFSNTVEWDEKAVTIERLSEPAMANFSWRYKMRPADFYFKFFNTAMTEYEENTPCVTATTSLMPEAYSQYIFAVSDKYVRDLPFRMTMKSTLQRLAGKAGTRCCEGNAIDEQSDIVRLPYDRYFDYDKGERSETIVN